MTALELLRAADPLDPAELEAWSGSLPGLPPPGVARRRARVLPLAVAVAAASAATVGVAVATGVLGGPAPDSIKAHLAELDKGMPADLQYGADLTHARTVAATDEGALYLADTRDGGYCVEIGSPAARPRGASCVPGPRLGGLPLDVLAPLPDDPSSPLLLGGRANDASITRITVRYPSGLTTEASFGLDRAWLVQVPDAEVEGVLSHGVVVTGLSTAGTAVTTVQVPALRDDDPLGTRHDADTPLVLTTTSDGADLTLVLGVQGRVNLTGVRLEIVFPDGTRQAVPVMADGSYALTLAAGRRDDFATRPGELVAVRDGRTIASRTLASVAWWRARNG